MTPLACLLIIKIAVYFVLLCVPLLFLPKARIDKLLGYSGAPIVFYRPYGVSILALLIGYAGGLLPAVRGETPWAVLAMGVISNTGAVFVLSLYGEAKKKRASIAFFGFIAAAMTLAALFPSVATSSF